MEKSSKKELIIYICILVLLIIGIVVKNFIIKNEPNNIIIENKQEQKNQTYLTVNNTTYNTLYDEEWMGDV